MSISTPFLIAGAIIAHIATTAFVLLFVTKRAGIRSNIALIAFSAGTFLALAISSLLPEAFELNDAHDASLWVLLGFIAFFTLSQAFHWYHHHDSACPEDHVHSPKNKARISMIITGDALHNAIDGALIAVAFSASIPLGIATTLSVLLHEVPQEISDFFVLLSSGLSRAKAFLANAVSGTASIVGAILGYSMASIDSLIGPLLAITAGNFLYIAASDLIPHLSYESHGTISTPQRIKTLLFFILGIGIVLLLLQTSGHSH